MRLNIEEIKELEALVSLIDEPNDTMFGEIRGKVLTYGKQAIPALEEAWVNTLSDIDSERIELLIDEIKKNEFATEFNSWKTNSGSGLFDGMLILSRYLQNQFDEETTNLQFNKLVREIWLEMNDNLTALEKIRVFNHIIFGVNKYTCTSPLPYKTDSYFINKLFSTKTGNPYSIGMLYIALAQKLDVPVFGVNLPNNFIVVYMENFKSIENYTGDDVLFYINPANYGSAFTHNEIKSYISQAGLKIEPEYFLPQSNNAVLKRTVNELLAASGNEHNHTRVKFLNQIVSII